MTIADFQNFILKETSIKTSVKKNKGSMKDYTTFTPIYQKGIYPEYDFTWRQNLIKQYTETDPPQIMVSSSQIQLHNSLLSGEALHFKREKKPLPIEQMKVRQWGSKNSQMRYDKAVARNHKRVMRGDGGARFY